MADNDELNKLLEEIDVTADDTVDDTTYEKPEPNQASASLSSAQKKLSGRKDLELQAVETVPTYKIDPRMSIDYDLQESLFKYYLKGVSLKAIHDKFGKKYNFSLHSLYTACTHYEWKKRRMLINQAVAEANDKEGFGILNKSVELCSSLIDEAIMTKQDAILDDLGDETGAIRVNNVGELTKIMETLLKVKDSMSRGQDEDISNARELSSDKADKVLQLLSGDDEEDIE